MAARLQCQKYNLGMSSVPLISIIMGNKVAKTASLCSELYLGISQYFSYNDGSVARLWIECFFSVLEKTQT